MRLFFLILCFFFSSGNIYSQVEVKSFWDLIPSTFLMFHQYEKDSLTGASVSLVPS